MPAIKFYRGHPLAEVLATRSSMICLNQKQECSFFRLVSLPAIDAYITGSAHLGNDDGNGLDVGDEDGDFEWDDDR